MEADLNDLELAALVAALEHLLSQRGVNVCGSEWGKQLGDGLFEFRIRHTANEIKSMFGPGSGSADRGKVLLRVLCHAYGDKIVLLLSGYDKGGTRARSASRRRFDSARQKPPRRIQGAPGTGSQVRAPRSSSSREGTRLTAYVLKHILGMAEGGAVGTHPERLPAAVGTREQRGGPRSACGVRSGLRHRPADHRTPRKASVDSSPALGEDRDPTGADQPDRTWRDSPTSATLARIAEALGADLRLVER